MSLYRYFTICLIAFVVVSCYRETEIPVKASFQMSFKNGDESVPVYVKMNNTSSGGEHYLWEFESGTPNTSTEKSPEVLYTQHGSYKVKLTVTNEYKESDTQEQTITIKDAIKKASFTKEIVMNSYPPVTVKFTNTTQGENLTYKWLFQGGTPETFEGKTPPAVVFSTEGKHEITLEVSNGYDRQTFSDFVEVKPAIKPAFSWQTPIEDEDLQVPVNITLQNKTENAISYQWIFQGGTPNTSTEVNPKVTYTNAGTYTIILVASNGKTTQTLQKQITVYPDTGIYVLENVKLGINYAHNSEKVAAFYSTKLKKSFFSKDITAENAPLIDIVFQGGSPTFASNKFVSPTEVQKYAFFPITGAKATVFVNSQEICNCGLNFTEENFNAMTNDTPLRALSITHSAAGAQAFTNMLPRIVLFQTHDGRKGAIKIKQFVSKGAENSYILCDIKVQK